MLEGVDEYVHLLPQKHEKGEFTMKKRSVFSSKFMCIYGLAAVFYLWMAYQIPYTHDDWGWGIDIGFQWFLHAIVNSRYAGNFFVVIMTRSVLLKTVIMGGCFFLIPFILSRFSAMFMPNASSDDKLYLFLLCNCVLLTMNREMWSQTYGWVAGYANFVVSALFMMPWIKEILTSFDDDPKCRKCSVFRLILYFLIGIVGQLFVENLALYHVIVGFALCFFHYGHHRKIPLNIIALWIGSVIGLVIMFSSNLYDTLFSTGTAIDDYRQIPLLENLPLSQLLFQTIRIITLLGSGLYARNHVICLLILSFLSYMLAYNQCTRKASYLKMLIMGNIVCAVLVVACVFIDNPSGEYKNLMHGCIFVVSVVFFVLVTCELSLLYRGTGKILKRMLTIWLSAPMLIAPLIVTTEGGSRLFFNSNIYLILFALLLFTHIIANSNVALNKKFHKIVSIAFAVLLAYHGFVYEQIGVCSKTRDSIIAQAIANDTAEITIPAFPFSDYLHDPDPTSFEHLEFFRDFYGIPEDMIVIFERTK